MTPLLHQHVDGALELAEALEALRQAGARQLVEHGEPVALEAGVLALPERRGGRQHQQVRQEIARLVHEVDAQLVVVDADVHVHAADGKPPADPGKVARERLVAGLLRRLERRFVGKGCVEAAIGARPNSRAVSAMVRRRWASSLRALAKSRHTLVPTSICERKNSGATCLPSAASQASMRAAGAAAKPRVARSTRWYSSSMPKVKDGSLSHGSAHATLCAAAAGLARKGSL